VVTSTLVFEGQGVVREFVGGYQDWLRQGGSLKTLGVGGDDSRAQVPVAAKADVTPVSKAPQEAPPRKKLSYKEQRELEALPGRIEALEAELEALQNEVAEPNFYQRPAEYSRVALERLSTLQQELDALLERWTELEA